MAVNAMTALDLQKNYVQQCAQYLGGAFGLEPEAILSRSRMAPLALARHLIVYRLRMNLWTQVEVGHLLNLDHSSVSHAEHRVPLVLRNEPDVARIYFGMPSFGGAVFSDVNLVQLYQRLEFHVSEAQELRWIIDAAIAQMGVPERTKMKASA